MVRVENMLSGHEDVAPVSAHLSKPGHRILVVDDNPDILKMTSFCLQHKGYEVTTASNGREALEKARQTGPVMAIIDRMMPEMDGVEVCRHLRQENPDIFLIMLTALGGEDNRISGLEAGADDYITKPFSPKELLLRVEAMLRRLKTSSLNVPPTKPQALSRTGRTGKLKTPDPIMQINSYLEMAAQAALSGDKPRARELFLRVLKLEPANSNALVWLAWHTEDPQQALHYLERLVAANPDNTKARELLEIARQHCLELNQLISASGYLSYWNSAEQLHKDRIVKGVDRRGMPVLPLGQLLLKKGFISADQLETALSLQDMFKKLGEKKRLGEILLEYGYVTLEQLKSTLTEQQSEFYSQFY